MSETIAAPETHSYLTSIKYEASHHNVGHRTIQATTLLEAANAFVTFNLGWKLNPSPTASSGSHRAIYNAIHQQSGKTALIFVKDLDFNYVW